MKSSFSWPGRPPAEMISRNVNRLLTSILGGSPKRGAFCTSILGGSPKRGAFYTSILDGTPKRGAFCTSILDGTLKRGAFCTSILGGTLKRDAFYTSILGGSPKRDAFCTSILDGALKRDAFFGRQGRGVSNTPSKRSRMGTRVAKGSQARDSLPPAGPFDGAYAIRPYDGTSKEGASYTSYLVATPKRGAFCTSYLVATPKRGAFLCTRVGAYCIRPTKRSRKGTGSAKGDQTCDFLSPTGPFGRAYAIRPYHATSKRDAFASSFSIVVFSSFIFLCLSSLFSSGKSSSRCSVMCAP